MTLQTSNKAELVAQQLANAANVRNIWQDVVINAKEYKVSGEVDDTAYLQRAINYAISTGKSDIWLPPGTYNYTTLTGTEGITFYGDSVILNGVTVLKMTSFNKIAVQLTSKADQAGVSAIASQLAVKANQADVDASLAIKAEKTVVDGIQSQVNTLVVSGDSSVEAAQARVDAVGKTYSTLQTRLNTEFGNVNQNTDVLSDSVYSYLGSVLTGTTTVDTSGILKIGLCENLADTDIDHISVNGTVICDLLPEEYVSSGTKYSGYTAFNFTSLNFDGANLANLGTDNARAQVTIVATGFRLDTNEYNVISTSAKFRSEKQTNFGSAADNYIGLHASGLIDIKVLKTDVLAGGFTWDLAGIRLYLKSLANFVYYIRKTSYVTSADTMSLLVKVGSVTVTKKSTTNIKLNFYTNIKGKDTENYSFKKYSAVVENTTNVECASKQISLMASFKPGECKSEKCIVVKDANGTVIPHQWEDDRYVNVQYDKNMGKYADGSLKDGYIWIVDTIAASTSKAYSVFVYEAEVAAYTASVQSADDGAKVTFTAANMICEFKKASKYLLDAVTVSGTSVSYVQTPSYKLTSSVTTYARNDSSVLASSYSVLGSGVVFKEFVLVLTYAGFFSITLRTKVFSNGVIQTKQNFQALRDITATELFGAHQRLQVFTGTTASFAAERAKFYRGSWPNGAKTNAVHVTFAHGDLPRTDATLPKYAAMGAITNDKPSTNIQEIVGGWEYGGTDTAYAIPSGMVFSSGMESNLLGFSDAVQNETDRVFNPLNGRSTSSTKIKLKTDILRLISEGIFNVNTDYDKLHEGGSFNFAYPSFLGRLALWKMYNISTLNQISADYKTLISGGYGGGSADTLFALYQSTGVQMPTMSRVFPAAEYFLREYQALGNSVEVAYYQGVIKSYAETLCRSIEAVGNTNIFYNNGFNANSTCAGLRGLSMGIKLEPANTRWISAYNVNLLNLTTNSQFLPVQNVLTDGPNQRLTTGHYIHYAAYAAFEYQKALENMGTNPVFNLTSYLAVATSAYGALREQEYCISSSRRGLGHTLAYAVYLFIKRDSTSSLANAKRLLERLIDQNKPDGGHDFPLENWKYQPTDQTYDGSVPFELQVLAEAMYNLLDQKIKTNY